MGQCVCVTAENQNKSRSVVHGFVIGSVLLLSVRQGLCVMIGITPGLAAVFVMMAVLESI